MPRPALSSPLRATGLGEFGAEDTMLPGLADVSRDDEHDEHDEHDNLDTVQLTAPPPPRAAAAAYAAPPETETAATTATAATIESPGNESDSSPQSRQARKKQLARQLTELRVQQDSETEDEKLRRLFDETDTNGGGTLDMKEIRALCKKLGDRMSATAVQEAFDRMDPDLTGEVGFEAFRRWRKLKMDMYRRELRKNVREVFDMVDEDGGGTLDIDECATMMDKIAKNFKGVDFDPPFHLETDFAAMDVGGVGEVTWDEFQDWFMERTGDDEVRKRSF
jgi:Ca2+-binding EF-hand superfamily protein